MMGYCVECFVDKTFMAFINVLWWYPVFYTDWSVYDTKIKEQVGVYRSFKISRNPFQVSFQKMLGWIGLFCRIRPSDTCLKNVDYRCISPEQVLVQYARLSVNPSLPLIDCVVNEINGTWAS